MLAAWGGKNPSFLQMIVKMEKTIRILLVDDDEEEYILVRDLLGDRSFFPGKDGPVHFDLHWTASYDEALQAFQNKSFDLYLIDYSLQDRDGITLVKEGNHLGNTAPVIMLTGLESYEMDIAAMQAGAVDYLVKNHINGPLLERSIRYAIGRMQAEEDLRKAQDDLEQRVVERTLELGLANNILREEIAERRQAQEALNKSEARFRTIFEKSGIGILLIDLQGNILGSNPALQAMLGYSQTELNDMTFDSLSQPQDIRVNNELFQKLLKGEVDAFQVERRCAHKNGKDVWVLQTVSLVTTEKGEEQFAIGMIENITERKQMEAELAEVRRRLLDSSETERLHLAQELHDGPVQDLYGTLYILEQLRDSLDEQGVLSLSQAEISIQRAIDTLRVTCGELRPPTLAPFGLEVAIRSHAENFQKIHPEIQIQLDLMSDGQILPERVRLAVFRIYQQALANILRHSKATQVDIRLWHDSNQVQLEIQDNGAGFSVPARWIDMVRQGHLGLAGSFERAEAFNGTMTVKSQIGKGTLIRVVAPRSAPIEMGQPAPAPIEEIPK